MIESFKAVPKLLRVLRIILAANFSGKGIKNSQSRALWQQEQAKRFLEALNIKVRCQGDFPTHGLIVCNHLSYLDIIVIASQGSVVFVAKSDVLRWPLIGNLLKHSGTILAYRKQPIKSAQTALEITAVLSQNLPIVLFPEGTSTGGERVLPFRAPFFQSAHDVSAKITPAALLYTSRTGNPQEDICYWGDHTFFTHLARLATIQDITAHLNLGEAQSCLSSRKESAAHFHKEVSELQTALKSIL